jgi:hypothetical protein
MFLLQKGHSAQQISRGFKTTNGDNGIIFLREKHRYPRSMLPAASGDELYATYPLYAQLIEEVWRLCVLVEKLDPQIAIEK